MKENKSDEYRQNAQNCSEMADPANTKPTFKGFKRMEEAWLALAEEQDWLDVDPTAPGVLP